MTVYVLLTDQDDGTALVACVDEESAEALGSAAIWGDGSVSAWRVPEYAFTDVSAVKTVLRDGGDCSDVAELGLSTVRREAGEAGVAR